MIQAGFPTLEHGKFLPKIITGDLTFKTKRAFHFRYNRTDGYSGSVSNQPLVFASSRGFIR